MHACTIWGWQRSLGTAPHPSRVPDGNSSTSAGLLDVDALVLCFGLVWCFAARGFDQYIRRASGEGNFVWPGRGKVCSI